MRLGRFDWRPWDQEQAIANARAASVELSRVRVEREEAYLYVAQVMKLRGRNRSA